MTNYVGRFAPTPSGPLHFGSMVAAVGSWLDARAHQGEWRLRIDDLDPPRVVPEVIDGFFRTLERFELHWDGPVLFQSKQSEFYESAVGKLKNMGLTFPCVCTRKDLAEYDVYPGTCRLRTSSNERALRFKALSTQVVWDDAIAGEITMDVSSEIGDFMLRNSHMIFSYHLANVIDDAMWNISHVIRGADLIPATGAQLLLMGALELPRPIHGHLPLALNAAGQKLSKQTKAPSVEERPEIEVLQAVLEHLGYENIPDGSVAELLSWAVNHWMKVRPTIQLTP